MSETKTYTMTVTDMTCEHCVETVTKALKDVVGVVNVAIDLEAHKVDVQYDSAKTDGAAVQAAVEAKGYTVESA